MPKDLATGLALKNSGKTEAAIGVFREILARSPDNLDARHHLGNSLVANDQTRQGIEELVKVFQARPTDTLTVYNLALAFYVDQQFERALILFAQALRQKPDFIWARVNYGLTLHALGRLPVAQEEFDKVLETQPKMPEANWNRALTLLSMGNYEKGWPAYEWRWRRGNRQRSYPHDFSQPQWDGSPFPGRTLLVFCEQGFGDAIQFARFLPLAKARGGCLLFECRRETAPLFARNPAIDETLIFSFQRSPRADFDLQIPLLSLPRVLGIEIDNLPKPCKPTIDSEKSLFWRRQLPEKFNIGLIWAGQPSHANDRHRSLPLRELAPLLLYKHAEPRQLEFFSLQLGEARGQLADLHNRGELVPIHDCAHHLHDFSDSAALINELDLLITVDTAAAHLGGSLERPTWILLSYVPDWRWLRNRHDSPWYNSVRLFRQSEPGDWQTPIATIMRNLEQIVR